MASYSIQKREKADGTVRHRCLVRVKKNGKILYTEQRTFTKYAAAEAWGKDRVIDIESNGFATEDTAPITLGSIISKALTDENIDSSIGRSKRFCLRLLSDCDIAKLNLTDIKPHHIIDHCKLRRSAGTGPSTIAVDVSVIRWLLRIAKSNFGHEVSQISVIEAYDALYSQDLIAKSGKRSRRPTTDEIERLKVGLAARADQRAAHIPYIDLLDFSILSCMRIGEVCRITWDDVDEAQKAVIVRDRKDPRKKAGNHMLVPMLGGAWEILQKQPRNDARVFPYNERSVTAGFQRVRNELGIEDLRYHDLRREGASRLFEKGYSIDEVAQVTGHRNINTLWQVYTELFPKRLHDKFKD
ncbi:tyrosine-type recombinase/integrase [Shewanella baltica]|uniref:Phage integrase family protein n=1 Tax=Shewanella baltica (strain OS155 / ATCC BAA-1091) TaxID=325240 RepID=A3D8J8_SHEB5|nr:site-specific integrase [Shewanella baltica]ABN63061.1 phage integrase family protein [Shewanella baltica OS155]AEH15399.1 integrase family protein [Shewanella baltica OS117]